MSILEAWPEIFQVGGYAGWVFPLQALERNHPTRNPPKPSHTFTPPPLGHTWFLPVCGPGLERSPSRLP